MNQYTVLENGIYYAELDGTKGCYELGKQNGQIFSDLIKKNVSVMRQMYGEAAGPNRLEEILDQMVGGSRYVSDLKEYVPSLYEEMQGIADGSGVSLKDVFMLNYLEEVPNLLLEEDSEKTGISAGKCTSAAVIDRKDRSNLLFQNMDFTDAFEGYQVLYKIDFLDKAALVYGFVGQFGGIGVNSKGLAVTINVITNVSANTGKGIPSTAITRMLLEQDSVEACVRLMEGLPISTGGSYTIVDPKTAVCLEASANKIVQIRPEDRHYIIHTNHAVQSDDVIDVPGAFNGAEPIRNEENNSDIMTVERFELAESMVSSMYARLDVEEAIKILATEPISLHCDLGAGLELNTLQSVISVCSADAPAIFVAKGREYDRKYVKIGF